MNETHPENETSEEHFDGATSTWDPVLRTLYLQAIFEEVQKNRLH